ncbi:Hypothetical protein BRZCDTV_452, partial [Brazilian cedratvirus IHUMI]
LEGRAKENDWYFLLLWLSLVKEEQSNVWYQGYLWCEERKSNGERLVPSSTFVTSVTRGLS